MRERSFCVLDELSDEKFSVNGDIEVCRITSLDQLRPAKRVKQAVTGNLGVSWIRLLYNKF